MATAFACAAAVATVSLLLRRRAHTTGSAAAHSAASPRQATPRVEATPCSVGGSDGVDRAGSGAESPTEMRIHTGHDYYLAARVWGPKEGKPIVALHGWLDNASTFDLTAPGLAEAGYRVYSLDLSGHGNSDHKPPGTFYHLVDTVADVSRAIDELGLDKFVVLGHSLGGSIGTFIAAMWPERVERVILVETLGPWATDDDKLPSQLAKSLSKRSHRPPRVFPDLEAAAQANSKGFLRTPIQASRVLVARGTRRVDGGYIWRTDPRQRELSRMPMTSNVCKAYATAVKCPTLIVTAKDGIYSRRSPEEVERRLGYYQRLTHVEIDQGGHHCHLTVPSVVTTHVLKFLKS